METEKPTLLDTKGIAAYMTDGISVTLEECKNAIIKDVSNLKQISLSKQGLLDNKLNIEEVIKKLEFEVGLLQNAMQAVDTLIAFKDDKLEVRERVIGQVVTPEEMEKEKNDGY